ncbi:hypothetical protein ACO229_06770 [Promicromonospora sp. MS192]|uniref:hypothetical protein n=1 Tax=Promicromonospora sp. MS192 TaxID=3412684 RepID=UPI003C2CAB50
MKKQPAPRGMTWLLANALVGEHVFTQVYQTGGDPSAAAFVTVTVLAGPEVARVIGLWQYGSASG